MSPAPLPSDHRPSMTEIAGRPATLHYGDVAGEYAALRMGAIIVDRSERGRMRLSGEKAPELVTGLVTGDVLALAPGQGLYAAALTPKGKIVADVRIFRRDDDLLVDVPPRAWEGWIGLVRKYVNPRLAPYRDVTGSLRDLGVFGARARPLVAGLIGLGDADLAALPAYGTVMAEVAGHAALVARVPDLDVEGYELFLPPEAFEAAWKALHAAGAVRAGLLAWDIARIEVGRPEWGIDIDDSTIPQEANFDELDAISYTKGCYVGQEVVARVHFRGHVNRQLRGLLCGQGEPPPAGATLVDATGKPVGDVRSSAVSPRLGAIALGMVRREIEPGATVTARWDDRETAADVVRLPFPL